MSTDLDEILEDCSEAQAPIWESLGLEEKYLKDSRFVLCKLDKCNFQEAVNYYIDPLENSIEGAKFSSPEVLSLLSTFKIKIDSIE